MFFSCDYCSIVLVDKVLRRNSQDILLTSYIHIIPNISNWTDNKQTGRYAYNRHWIIHFYTLSSYITSCLLTDYQICYTIHTFWATHVICLYAYIDIIDICTPLTCTCIILFFVVCKLLMPILQKCSPLVYMCWEAIIWWFSIIQCSLAVYL